MAKGSTIKIILIALILATNCLSTPLQSQGDGCNGGNGGDNGIGGDSSIGVKGSIGGDSSIGVKGGIGGDSSIGSKGGIGGDRSTGGKGSDGGNAISSLLGHPATIPILIFVVGVLGRFMWALRDTRLVRWMQRKIWAVLIIIVYLVGNWMITYLDENDLNYAIADCLTSVATYLMAYWAARAANEIDTWIEASLWCLFVVILVKFTALSWWFLGIAKYSTYADLANVMYGAPAGFFPFARAVFGGPRPRPGTDAGTRRPVTGTDAGTRPGTGPGPRTGTRTSTRTGTVPRGLRT